jgi:GNAT superfamily N-acetyltransferase
MNVSIRTCASSEEKARSLAIYNEVVPRRRVTPEQVANWERTSFASVELLAAVDGDDVGSVAVSVFTPDAEDALTLLTVLPAARGRGVGAALYAAASAWLETRGLDTIDARVEEDDAESLAFAKRRGFVEQWRESGLELDVRTAQVAFEPPEGVELVPLAERPELAGAVYAVACESMGDVPGHEGWQPPEPERFLQQHVLSPQTELTLAVADGEVVGYAKLVVDGTRGVHSMTAVRRAWRGRGVARALKTAQIAWAAAHGLERLETTNERRNDPMLKVNRALGYRPAVGRIGLLGPLASAR